MFKLILQFLALLSPDQRRRFYVLQVFVVLMTFGEIFGVASIGPFMAMVGDIEILNGDNLLAKTYQFSGIESEMEFLFASGVVVLSVLAISALISMFTVWRLSLFAAKVGTEISDRLYRHYVHQDWIFHAQGSSAQLTKQISTEAVRVTDRVIHP